MRHALLGALVLGVAGCAQEDGRVAASDALEREVEHATNLAIAACKADRDGAVTLRATTTADAFSLALGLEASCAATPECAAPARSAERAASVRELSPETLKVLDEGSAATERALARASGEGRGRLQRALSASQATVERASALAKLCGSPARVSEVPEAMSRVSSARDASRAATKALRDGG